MRSTSAPHFPEYDHYLNLLKEYEARHQSEKKESEVQEGEQQVSGLAFLEKIKNNSEQMGLALQLMKELTFFQEAVDQLKQKLTETTPSPDQPSGSQAFAQLPDLIQKTARQVWKDSLIWGNKILSHHQGYDPEVPDRQMRLIGENMLALRAALQGAARACQWPPQLQDIQMLYTFTQNMPKDLIGNISRRRDAHYKEFRNRSYEDFAIGLLVVAAAAALTTLAVVLFISDPGFFSQPPPEAVNIAFGLVTSGVALFFACSGLLQIQDGIRSRREAARYKEPVPQAHLATLDVEQAVIEKTRKSFSAFLGHLKTGQGLFPPPMLPEQKVQEQITPPVKNFNYYVQSYLPKINMSGQ